jgi:hypothetical protein
MAVATAATEPATSGPILDGTTAPLVSSGSSPVSDGESATTSGIDCDDGLIACNGTCIDPLVDPSHCGASAPCDANPGASCDLEMGELCQEGSCQACTLLYDFEVEDSIADWELVEDWRLYTVTPPSTFCVVLFASVVLGTDGNRAEPYPNAETEDGSYALSSPILFGQTLAFRSWHVDEGGSEGLDSKVIEIDPGTGTFETLVDCATGVGSQVFCQADMGPRASDEWDEIILDTSAYDGMTGMIRFSYFSGDSGEGFEQGWFIDDLRVGGCGAPTAARVNLPS